MRCLLFALLLAMLATACSLPDAAVGPQAAPRSDLVPVLANDESAALVTVREHVWMRTYAVEAKGGVPGIRAQLDRHGPYSSAAKRRFDALTTWALHWTFRYDRSGGGCALAGATVELEAIVTLPELTATETLAPDVFNLWQAYRQQLQSHEDGHVNIYRAAARELRDEFLATPAMGSCEELRAALGARGEAKLAAIRAADRAYDADTGHGCSFP